MHTFHIDDSVAVVVKIVVDVTGGILNVSKLFTRHFYLEFFLIC